MRHPRPAPALATERRSVTHFFVGRVRVFSSAGTAPPAAKVCRTTRRASGSSAGSLAPGRPRSPRRSSSGRSSPWASAIRAMRIAPLVVRDDHARHVWAVDISPRMCEYVAPKRAELIARRPRSSPLALELFLPTQPFAAQWIVDEQLAGRWALQVKPDRTAISARAAEGHQRVRGTPGSGPEPKTRRGPTTSSAMSPTACRSEWL